MGDIRQKNQDQGTRNQDVRYEMGENRHEM